jgi:hypothetical protein
VITSNCLRLWDVLPCLNVYQAATGDTLRLLFTYQLKMFDSKIWACVLKSELHFYVSVFTIHKY